MSTELLDTGPMLVTSFAARSPDSGQLVQKLQLTSRNGEGYAVLSYDEVWMLTDVLRAWLKAHR